jgi:hypothetical protein
MEEPQLFLTVTKEALAAAARARTAVAEAYILTERLIWFVGRMSERW